MAANPKSKVLRSRIDASFALMCHNWFIIHQLLFISKFQFWRSCDLQSSQTINLWSWEISSVCYIQSFPSSNEHLESCCSFSELSLSKSFAHKIKVIYKPLYLLWYSNVFLEKITPKYSLLDFVFSLVSLAHFIYACVRQTACSTDVNYSSWRCYNAFGYRLYNYVLPNVIAVLLQSTIQVVNIYTIEDDENDEDNVNWKRKVLSFFKKLLLFGTIFSNALMCLVFVPYFITNALPMFVGFIWLLGPLIIVLVLAYAIFTTIVLNIILSCTMCSCCGKECRRLFGTHCAVGLQVFGCLAMSMAYNYSQYCYFGGGYLTVIGYEFQSRDTTAWGRAFANSSDLQAHNMLAFF